MNQVGKSFYSNLHKKDRDTSLLNIPLAIHMLDTLLIGCEMNQTRSSATRLFMVSCILATSSWMRGSDAK